MIIIISYDILSTLVGSYLKGFTLSEFIKYILNNLKSILYCQKCLSFWLLLIFTGSLVTAFIVAYSVSIILKIVEYYEYRGIKIDG